MRNPKPAPLQNRGSLKEGKSVQAAVDACSDSGTTMEIKRKFLVIPVFYLDRMRRRRGPFSQAEETKPRRRCILYTSIAGKQTAASTSNGQQYCHASRYQAQILQIPGVVTHLPPVDAEKATASFLSCD
jgi:hypothetical protein